MNFKESKWTEKSESLNFEFWYFSFVFALLRFETPSRLIFNLAYQPLSILWQIGGHSMSILQNKNLISCHTTKMSPCRPMQPSAACECSIFEITICGRRQYDGVKVIQWSNAWHNNVAFKQRKLIFSSFHKKLSYVSLFYRYM